jgi:hypothetical protein
LLTLETRSRVTTKVRNVFGQHPILALSPVNDDFKMLKRILRNGQDIGDMLFRDRNSSHRRKSSVDRLLMNSTQWPFERRLHAGSHPLQFPWKIMKHNTADELFQVAHHIGYEWAMLLGACVLFPLFPLETKKPRPRPGLFRFLSVYRL